MVPEAVSSGQPLVNWKLSPGGDHRLGAHHAGAAHFLHRPAPSMMFQIARQKLHRLLAPILDGDGVGPDIAVVFGIGLVVR